MKKVLGRVLSAMGTLVLGLIVSLTGVVAVSQATVTDAYASADPAAACTGTSSLFLGLRPWFHGLTTWENGDCKINAPSDVPTDGKKDIPTFVWIAVLNLLADATILAGIVAVGFIVYGGFKYIMSRGEPGRIQQGKAILTTSVTGLFICLLATIIVNSILAVLMNAARA